MLRARQYSAVDRAAGRYFVMVQPVEESSSNVTSIGAPRLFAVDANAGTTAAAAVQELELRMADTAVVGAGDVPPMEAIELDASSGSYGGNGSGSTLLGIGRRGALYSIDADPSSTRRRRGGHTVATPSTHRRDLSPSCTTQGISTKK